ncbi:MAG: sulfur carrier protein ThiS [Bacteroidales bacterium]|nr:sulfur carrier protein ThiS [Bacteroidales bacterium]
MEVFINNRLIFVEDNCSLLELLSQQSFASLKGIAVAVNNKVIPKKEIDSFKLKNKDKVIVIKAVCGG